MCSQGKMNIKGINVYCSEVNKICLILCIVVYLNQKLKYLDYFLGGIESMVGFGLKLDFNYMESVNQINKEENIFQPLFVKFIIQKI